MSAVAESRERGRTVDFGSPLRAIERDHKTTHRLSELSARSPFLDAALVLIAAGYDPASWVEGWRPGARTFALRARLEIAAGLTVDETRSVFAAWKPFFPSAVSSSIRHSEEAASTLAPTPSALLLAPPEQQSKKPAETELGAARPASSVADECTDRIPPISTTAILVLHARTQELPTR
jgi:hypothetical protein